MAGEEVHVILGQYIAGVIKNADAWTVQKSPPVSSRTKLPTVKKA
jgi:hypothetical protein